MNDSGTPLLITATVRVARDVRKAHIRDTSERLLEYITALLCWIDSTSIQSIVFCDNSDYSFDYSHIINIASKKGKKLEILRFDGNADSVEKGKGYAEIGIIDYALEHSDILKNATHFYKCSGRYFPTRFNRIDRKYCSNDLVFFMPQKSVLEKYPETVSTVFFKTSIQFYRDQLSSRRELVEDKDYTYIEHVFYQVLKSSSYTILKPYNIIGRVCDSSRLYDGIYYSKKKMLEAQKIIHATDSTLPIVDIDKLLKSVSSSRRFRTYVDRRIGKIGIYLKKYFPEFFKLLKPFFPTPPIGL